MKTLNNARIPVPIGIFALIIAGLSFMTGCKKEINEPAASDVSNEVMASARGTTTVTRYPLLIPSTITASSFTLTAAEGTHNFGPSSSIKTWQYNGSFPGPTIIATKGDVISARYQNNIPEPSIIHWHGMLVNHENDGQPMQVIPNGASYSYNFPVINRAALNWYHPHPHMVIGKQV